MHSSRMSSMVSFASRRSSMKSPLRSPRKLIRQSSPQRLVSRRTVKPIAQREFEFYQMERVERKVLYRQQFCEELNLSPESRLVDQFRTRVRLPPPTRDQKRRINSSIVREIDFANVRNNQSCDCSECGHQTRLQTFTNAFPKRIRRNRKLLMKRRFKVLVIAIMAVNRYKSIWRRNAFKYRKHLAHKIVPANKLQFYQHPKDFDQNLNHQFRETVSLVQQEQRHSIAISRTQIRIKQPSPVNFKTQRKVIREILPKHRQPYANVKEYITSRRSSSPVSFLKNESQRYFRNQVISTSCAFSRNKSQESLNRIQITLPQVPSVTRNSNEKKMLQTYLISNEKYKQLLMKVRERK